VVGVGANGGKTVSIAKEGRSLAVDRFSYNRVDPRGELDTSNEEDSRGERSDTVRRRLSQRSAAAENKTID
jgi:hypothetical protein